MGFRSPFFRKLFLPYVLLLGGAVAALGVLAAEVVHGVYLEDTQQALRKGARLVDALVADDLRAGAGPSLALKLKAHAESIGYRITVVADDGRVLADSEVDPVRMDNHRLRPEIVAAAGQGEGGNVRHSETLGVDMMYWAARFGGAGGGTPHYVRLAVPLTRIETHLRSLYALIALAASLAAALGGLLSYVFASRMARAVIELTRMAEALERGDLQRRIHPEWAGELSVLGRSLNAMAESLGRAEASAARSHDERLAILEAMTEGVIATDGRLAIRFGNPAAAALLDFPPAGIEGRPLWEVVRDDRILKAAQEAIESGRRQSFPAGPVRERHLAVTISPLPSREGPQGIVLVVRDVSQEVRYVELRKEFVANVSHELRTPLAAVQGFVETLQEGAIRDPEKGPAFLAIIAKHVRQLANLVTDLLEISRLESRSDLPRRVPVDLARAVRNVLDLLGPAAQRKRQTLTADLPEGLPAVAGDPDYLERAMANLVDNAVKYTPEGGAIRISAARRDAAVMVEVADTGIGIPAEDLPRVFERFYRVDKSRSREMGGTGLGLSIVKHITQAHGGSVEALSEPGKGSVFRLVLPALS
jgi:two-component system phosphate regulon sensor histidine kinase PhoR